jgi:hypothetical protein
MAHLLKNGLAGNPSAAETLDLPAERELVRYIDLKLAALGLWFAKTLSDSDFNRIQGCRPQVKCDSTLGWSTPFGYS